MDGPSKQRFINDDHTISVIIEENLELTLEEENMIKNRLKELGYL